jgi:hypothetical protein
MKSQIPGSRLQVLCLLASAFCLLAHAGPGIRQAGIAGSYNRPAPASDGGGGGGCTPGYGNKGGTGDRRSIITISDSGNGSSAFIHSSPATSWINGSTADSGNFWSGSAISGAWAQFDFGSGNAVLITEATYYQSSPQAQGAWKWQGSNDASSWTDIGGAFTLGTSATQVLTTLSGNTTAYRYYRILGVSGSTSNGPWVYEFEFKLCGI